MSILCSLKHHALDYKDILYIIYYIIIYIYIYIIANSFRIMSIVVVLYSVLILFYGVFFTDACMTCVDDTYLNVSENICRDCKCFIIK